MALVDLLLWYYDTSDVALVDLLLWYYDTSDVAPQLQYTAITTQALEFTKLDFDNYYARISFVAAVFRTNRHSYRNG